MTNNELRLLSRINLQVNREITYTTDPEQYGLRDYWVFEPASKKGDCEDYALTKLHRLAKAGFPVRRMAIYVVYTYQTQDYHAILVVDNTHTLDNNFDQVMLWSSMGSTYKLIKVIRPRT